MNLDSRGSRNLPDQATRQLRQVVLNLATNALQSMPDSGRLTCRTRFHESDGTIELEIGDTGPGIDPTVRSRLFEPFFTTPGRPERAWDWQSAGRSSCSTAAELNWNRSSRRARYAAWRCRRGKDNYEETIKIGNTARLRPAARSSGPGNDPPQSAYRDTRRRR